MRKLSEAEWINRFEQVQGRKPKPDELQLAYQSGLIGISKIIIISIFFWGL